MALNGFESELCTIFLKKFRGDNEWFWK